MTPDEIRTRAFNLGCNARLTGNPLDANPYACDTLGRASWKHGYLHVEGFWGHGVKGRWPVKPLPPVRQPITVNGVCLLQQISLPTLPPAPG